MKKVMVLIFSISLILTGCQTGSEETSFSFGDDLVFKEHDQYIEIDLEKSSETVKAKHEALSKIFSDAAVLEDIAAMTTTTANVLEKAGIQVTAAPESESLADTLKQLQYTLGTNQKIDKSKVLNIGSALSPNVEAVIELAPSVALYSDAMPEAKYMTTLKDAGVNIQPLAQSDYLDMFVLLDVLGSVTDHKDEEINNLFKDMVNSLKAVQDILDEQVGKEQPSVAILQVAESTILSNNNDSVLGKIVSALGMKNVFANNGNAEINTEELIAANPDYIIYFTHGNAKASLDKFNDVLYAEDSVYRELDAVKNKRAFAVSSDDFTFAASVDLDIVKVIEFLAKHFYE